MEAELRRRIRSELEQAREENDGQLDDTALAGIIARAVAAGVAWHLEAPEHTRNATLSSRTWRPSSGPRGGRPAEYEDGGPRRPREFDRPPPRDFDRRPPRDFDRRPPRDFDGPPREYDQRPRRDFDRGFEPRPPRREQRDFEQRGPRGGGGGFRGGGFKRGGFGPRRPPPRSR